MNGLYESSKKEVQSIVLVLGYSTPRCLFLPQGGEKATFILAPVYDQTYTILSAVIQTQSSWSSVKSEVSMHRDLGKTNWI